MWKSLVICTNLKVTDKYFSDLLTGFRLITCLQKTCKVKCKYNFKTNVSILLVFCMIIID